MGYDETLSYLYGLQKHGLKFGLDNIRAILSLLGEPQRAFRSIHIAGTNGKGSTSAMIERLLREAGMRTGLFTSPHILSFKERIRISGTKIDEKDVIGLTDEIRRIIGDINPTFFEFVTAMAFLYFMRRNVAIAVIEVGMGGRLDATNCVEPEVSVITPIGLDHKEFLGRDLKEIASEKAGIIKKGIPVVSAAQEPPALEVIENRAKELSSRVFLEGRDFEAVFRGHYPDGIVIDYRSASLELSALKVSLRGRHQAQNAALALRAVEEIVKGDILKIKNSLSDTHWQGRLERVSNEPEIIIDGAHNPHSAKALRYAIEELYPERGITLILGIMSDKDIEGILRELLPISDEVIFTAPNYERAEPPQRLKDRALGLGYKAKVVDSIKDAIGIAKNLNPKNLILITGSFYTIGEAKEALGYEAALMDLRESFKEQDP